MKIFCTEAERLEMLTMIAVYNGCLCTPPKRKEESCKECKVNTIEWIVKDGDGE